MALLCIGMSLTTSIAKDVACHSVLPMWKEFARAREGHVLTKSRGILVVIPLPRRFNRDRAICVTLPVPRAIHDLRLTWREIHIRNVPNVFLSRVILKTHNMRPALQHNMDAGRHEQVNCTTLPRTESFQISHELV